MTHRLTPKQHAFLQRRRPLLRAFPWMAGLLIAGSAGTVAWLVLRSPLLFNPSYVLARIQADTLCPATLRLMAGLLPMMSITCLFAFAALVAVMVSAWSHERRYLAMLDQLLQEDARPDPPDAP